MTNIRKSIAFTLLIIVTGLISANTVMATPSKRSIEKTIARTMEEFQLPGMAVSIVYQGKLYYSAGHGIVETGTHQPVDDRTLFQIASLSKAFTAATLAILADDGKLDWDDPVIDFLPEFRMSDPWVTREFTIRDLLTHRSGLPLGAGDLLLFPQTNSTREDIILALRYLKPASSFRSEFAYDNLLYIIAGEVVARTSGISFEEFLEQRLLFPLGMRDCTATLARVDGAAVKATPHVLTDGKHETTLSLESSLGSAAGGINCSARSMATWMSFILNKGLTAEGEQLISGDNFSQLLKPVTLLPGSGYVVEHTGSYLNAYALGWGVSTFYGQPMLSHSGGLWGMTTFIVLLPEQNLGVFVTNNLLSPAPRAAVNDIVDQFLKGISKDTGKDWIAIVAEASSGRRSDAAAAVAEAEASRTADSKPSLPLDAYVGTYRDPWYGNIEITTTDDDRLHFQSGRSETLSGRLEHFQFDTFIARWSDRKLNADAYVSFSLSPTGEVERIRMKAVSPTTDFSFDFHDLDLLRVQEPGEQ
ncbi:MAG: serine hydrolase [Gammaproteobacteria bacterium]|nr:serine hydrolase [Gammaproteobacteria bacterium]MDH4315996.1 serine hydrolase [Gammaproteobacteria bacterium]MDH5214867.1 serine hydrolase [Gammaproteobacteria bacterium]